MTLQGDKGEEAGVAGSVGELEALGVASVGWGMGATARGVCSADVWVGVTEAWRGQERRPQEN